MTYEQLDTIADAYIPLLAILLLSLMIKRLFSKDYLPAKQIALQTLFSIIVVYALMALDNSLKIWPSLSMDYSTHTALSLVLVMRLAAHYQDKWLRASFVMSFVAYLILMLYQKYHTLADILSTLFIIVVIVGSGERLVSKIQTQR